MNNIKVNLCIALPGRVMYSEQECSKNPAMNDMFTMSLKDDKDKVRTYKIFTRKSIPAKKIMNISHEAYYHMISPVCPEFEDARYWKMLKPIERLEKHLANIAREAGGSLIYYKVLED